MESRTERSVPTSVEKSYRLLSADYSEAANVYLQNPNFGIYRGYSKHSAGGRFKREDIVYINDPTVSERRSRDTNNFYNWFISKSERWKNYPPRDRSLVATMIESTAYHYGSMVYCLIPENNSRFVVSSSSDVWGAFRYTESWFGDAKSIIATTSRLSEFIFQTLRILNVKDFSSLPVIDMMDKDPQKIISIVDVHFQEVVQNIDKIVDYFHKIKSPQLAYFSKQVKNHSNLGSFRDILDEMFDPKKNKMELVHGTRNMVKYSDKNLEIWTDATCLLVPLDIKDEYFSKYKEIINR